MNAASRPTSPGFSPRTRKVAAAIVLSAFMTSAPAATYTYSDASEEMCAFEILNNERARCGFGLLRQSEALDSAAKGHANWIIVNKNEGHMQIPDTPGFTGVAPWDRVVVSSYGPDYSFESTEVMAFHSWSEQGAAARAVRGLLNAPYHLLNILRGWREVGLGVKARVDLELMSGQETLVTIELATKNNEGLYADKSSALRTYPCEGATGMIRSLHAETPNPFPGRDLHAHPVGTSIGVVAPVGSTLLISSASITNVRTGAKVAILQPVSGSTDPNAAPLPEDRRVLVNEGYISSESPMNANTPYQVSISGTTNRIPFTRTFTFVTGP